jgi:hypothetical protein
MTALRRTEAVPASLDIDVDHAIPRLNVTIRGGVTGNQVGRALAGYYLEHPEVVKLDMLFDLSEYQGAVEAEHVKLIVDAYATCHPDPRHPCRTAFVTPDKNFRLWAAAMSFQFCGREHRAYATREEALEFLAEPMEQRPPFEATQPG